MVWIIVLVIVLALGAWVIGAYNGLIRYRNYVEEGYSQIDVQLQRRNDLIPNLVNVVKGYAKHESETLEAVIKARQQLVQLPKDADPETVNALSNELSGALSRLMAVSEAYPDLKANTNFLNLQEELTSTENKIGNSRQFYNSSVTTYNNKLQVFPTNIIANMLGFEKKAYLDIAPEARNVPVVEF